MFGLEYINYGDLFELLKKKNSSNNNLQLMKILLN